jgi:DNA repair exonuclease SbcCD ATPase subunit
VLETRLQDLERDVQELEFELDVSKMYDEADRLQDLVDKYSKTDDAYTRVSNELRDVTARVTEQRTFVRDMEERVAAARVREQGAEERKRQERVIEELREAANEAERVLTPLKQYAGLIGSKGIPTRLMFERVADLQGYVNGILERFTKYSMVISYKDTGDSCSFMLRNRETGVLLSACRLSGYEKLTVQLALKRALNKFSYMTKSSIMIIDEAFDCIDVANFDSMLPEAVNLITEDYSVCLAISQRDISHISDLRCTIARKNDKAVITCT